MSDAVPTRTEDDYIADYHRSSLGEIQALLEDGDFMQWLGQQPVDVFSQEQKDAVRRLADRIAPTPAGKRKAAGGTAGRRRGARPSIREDVGDIEPEGLLPDVERESNDWKIIMEITELSIDEDTAQKMENFQEDGDVAPFLFSQSERVYPPGIWDSPGALPAEAFGSLLANTDQLNREKDISHKQWLFTMLAWYRIKELLVPGSGQGINFSMGHQQMNSLRNQIETIQSISRNWPDGWDAEMALTYVRDWAKTGFKIEILVSKFGPGCLLVLHKQLTEYFLLKKITRSGASHDAAVAHLRALGLTRFVQDNHMDEYAAAILGHLLRPFATARRV